MGGSTLDKAQMFPLVQILSMRGLNPMKIAKCYVLLIEKPGKQLYFHNYFSIVADQANEL